MNLTWRQSPFLPLINVHLDARAPCEHCVVSHAHSDHLANHQHAILTPETRRLATGRATFNFLTEVKYRTPFNMSNDVILTLFPAGHVLGSAMTLLQDNGSQLLYTGDFKLQPSLTCQTVNLVPCDQLLMECTYGLPHFRFPPRAEIQSRLLDLIHQAFREGKQPIVFGYALGKAQEANRMLTDAGFKVTAHGAVANVSEIYRELGVDPGPFQRYRRESFHGPSALDLTERGVLLAPPTNTRTPFTTSIPNTFTVMLSGWGIDKNAKYRYGVDEVLPLSDHADFDDLLRTVEETSPKTVYLQHGYVKEFAETLRGKGIDARPIEPDPQLELF